MDHDSTADEDDQNIASFSNDEEYNRNIDSNEEDNSRVFYFADDGCINELTDSPKADLQTSCRMNFSTDAEEIASGADNVEESLSQMPSMLLDAPLQIDKCNEVESTNNELQRMEESEKMISIGMNKSCDIKGHAVISANEKDELIKNMGIHIKHIWDILFQFSDKLDKAELLTKKEKLDLQKEFEDGYLPLKISQDKVEKDYQQSLNQLLVPHEKPSKLSLSTSNCDSGYLNTHLKDPADYSSPLSSSIHNEETNCNNIDSSMNLNKFVNNPLIKRSKAKKSFTRSQKPPHLPQDKILQDTMCVTSEHGIIPFAGQESETSASPMLKNSCIDYENDPFSSASMQTLYEQDPTDEHGLIAERTSHSVSNANESISNLISEKPTHKEKPAPFSDCSNFFNKNNQSTLEKSHFESGVPYKKVPIMVESVNEVANTLKKNHGNNNSFSGYSNNYGCQKVCVEGSSESIEDLHNTEVKKTAQSEESLFSLVQNDLELSDDEIDQVKSNEAENSFKCKNVKHLEMNLAQPTANVLENFDTAKSANKIDSACNSFTDDYIPAADINYSAPITSSNDTGMIPDSRNEKTFFGKLNNPIIKQAKARKKFSKKQSSAHSVEEKSPKKSSPSIGNKIDIHSKQNLIINSSSKQNSFIQAEDSSGEKGFLSADSTVSFLPEQISYKETKSYLSSIHSAIQNAEAENISYISKEATRSVTQPSINGGTKSYNSVEGKHLNSFQQANNDSMIQKVFLGYKNSLEKQKNACSISDVDSNLSRSNQMVGGQNILPCEKQSFSTHSKNTFLEGGIDQIKNDLALSGEDVTLHVDLEKNCFKDYGSAPLKKVEDFSPASPNIIEFSHKYKENSTSIHDGTLAVNQTVSSSAVDSSSNEAEGFGSTNSHSGILNNPMVKKAKARKKFSRKQNINHDVGNKTQQNVSSNPSYEGLNSEKGVASFEENLEMSITVPLTSCNSVRDELFTKKYPEYSPESPEKSEYEENKSDTEKIPIIPFDSNGNANGSNHVLRGPPLRDSAALNQSDSVDSSISDNDSSNSPSSAKNTATNNKIFTLFQNSILNPFIKQPNATQKIVKKPRSASSHGDISQQSMFRDLSSKTSCANATEISDKISTEIGETNEEEIAENSCTKNDYPTETKLINQIHNEKRNSFIQNSFSVKKNFGTHDFKQSPSIPHEENSPVQYNPDFPISQSGASIVNNFRQEKPMPKDVDSVLGKNFSSENNFISKAPLFDDSTLKDILLANEKETNDNLETFLHSTKDIKLLKNDLAISDDEISSENSFVSGDSLCDHTTSEDNVLVNEKVTNDNLKKSLHISKNIVLIRNDLAISDDEIDDLCVSEKDISTEMPLPISASNLATENKLQTEVLNLRDNSNLLNAECTNQNEKLPIANNFHSINQSVDKLDNIIGDFKKSSSSLNHIYLSEKTNNSFKVEPLKRKPNIPVSTNKTNTEMVQEYLNKESIELIGKIQLPESTTKRKISEDYDRDNFSKYPMKKSSSDLNSEQSSLSDELSSSALPGLSVSPNWLKEPVRNQDSSGSIEEDMKPGISVLKRNISESKEKPSSTVDNVNSSIAPPLKKKLKPTENVTAFEAPVRVRGRTSQFKAFFGKSSNDIVKTNKGNGIGFCNPNELRENSPQNFDQDINAESCISIKKPKIRKEHQKKDHSNKTQNSHHSGNLSNLREVSSEYSTQFLQDAKISRKNSAELSKLTEKLKSFTASKSLRGVDSSAEDKIVAMKKKTKTEKNQKISENEKSLHVSRRDKKEMKWTYSMKEKTSEEESLELCSSLIVPPSDSSIKQSTVNDFETIPNYKKNSFEHSEIDHVSKKQNCSINSMSAIANSSSSKNILSCSENLSVNDNSLRKAMEFGRHFESDSDQELVIDEGEKKKKSKEECMELCSSSMKLQPDSSIEESEQNGSEHMLDINDKVNFGRSESKCFVSKKRTLTSEIQPVLKKQNCSVESMVAISSDSKNLLSLNKNLSVNDNSLSKTLQDDYHFGNDSDGELVINDYDNEKPATCDNSTDGHFQETSEKFSNIKSNCPGLREKHYNFAENSNSNNFENVIPSDYNEVNLNELLLQSKNSISSAQISSSCKSEISFIDEMPSDSILSNISISSSATNYSDENSFSITPAETSKISTYKNSTISGTKTFPSTSNSKSKRNRSKQKSKDNKKEGFINKGSQKFQHAQLVENIIKNKSKSIKDEADLPFSLGIEEILDNIKGVQAGSEAFINYVNSLTNFLSNPQNAPDNTTLIFLVVHYLHLRQAIPLLKFLSEPEAYPFILTSETCIATSLVEIDRLAKPHLQGLMKSLLSVMYHIILEKKKLNIGGLSSLCRVFADICKRNGDRQNPLNLCCDLLKRKHWNSSFLIASITGVWKEIFEIPDNFSDEQMMFLSSIGYGAQKRFKKSNKSFYKCSFQLIEEYIAVPSIPNARQAIELLKEQIVSKSLQGSFENLWYLTSSLAILASREPWDWIEQTVLKNYIVINLKRFSSQDVNEKAFDLFCELYVDIYFLSPTKFADKVLIQFVEKKVSKGKEFVQDCAAAALMKYLILVKRDVPASLTVFFEKNRNNPKAKLFEDIVRRRTIPTREEKLSVKDVMVYE